MIIIYVQFEMLQEILQITISDWRMFHKGIVAGKRKIYTRSYEKRLDEIYVGEIHAFAKMCKAEYTVPLRLLPDQG